MIPIALIVIISIWVVLSMPLKKEIHLKYNGIEFHQDTHGNEKNIEIQIDGEYTSTLPGTHDVFEGTIIVGDQIIECQDYPLKLNKEGMASLDINPFSSNPELVGFVFTKRNFEALFIQRFSEPQNGVRTSSGWGISAPAKDRKEAEEVAGELSKKAGMNLLD